MWTLRFGRGRLIGRTCDYLTCWVYAAWGDSPQGATTSAQKSFKQACYNVVLGGQMAQYVAPLGLESKRICIIHNWVDGHLIRCTPGNFIGLRGKGGQG